MRTARRWCTVGLFLTALVGCRRVAPAQKQALARARANADGGRCAHVLGHPRPDCDYPVYDGFELVMAEEFDSAFDLDRDPLWTWSDGYSDMGHCRFIKEAIAISGGLATITMDWPAVPISAKGYPSYAEGLADEYPAEVRVFPPLSSGEIRTKYNMFRYGRYEFRVRPPRNITGNFMASAFIFRSPKWQDWSEVDIELQARSATVVQSNVVVGQNLSKYEPDLASVRETRVWFDTQTDFHTYVIEWLPTVVNIFVDPEKIKKPIRRFFAQKGHPMPAKPGKVMMNFWAYEKLNRNTYPMEYKIDWVRAYKSNLETGNYPCADTPECLTPEDRDYSKNNANDGIPPTKSGVLRPSGESASVDVETGATRQP